MLNKIIRFFRPEVTVASITASFAQQVATLDALSDAKRAEVLACDEQITALEEKQNAAILERNKAATIAARIAALIEA